MAHTALDAWEQHIVGPAVVWLAIGLPVGAVVYIATLVGPWRVPRFHAGLYWFLMAFAAVVVVGTAVGLRLTDKGDSP